MKTIYKAFIIIAAFLLVASCENELLNLTNPNVPTTGSFYKTEAEAVLAINSVYSALQFYGVFNRYWNYVNSSRSDESIFTDKQAGLPEVNGLDNFTMTGTVVAVKETWTDNYNGIRKANMVIEKVPDIEFQDQDLKNRILGEAYFLRAIFHYNLVNNFGEEIPMYTSLPVDLEDFYPSPAKPGEIYDLLEADFKKAKDMLPIVDTYRGTPELGRVSKGAAAAFLGKVYLWREKYDLAAAEFLEIINGDCGTYALIDLFRDNHNNDNENNIESIFEVQYKLSPTGDVWNISGENQSASEANIIEQEMTMIDGTGGMWWNQKPSPAMLAEFEKSDPRYYKTFWCPGGDRYRVGRRNLTYEQYISTARNGQIGWRKWCRDYATDSWESDVNIRIMRLADVYLMYAECMIEKVTPDYVTAAQYINLVRDRARNEPDAANYALVGTLPTVEELIAATPVINGRTIDNYRAALRHERMVELAYEGKRWEDILRWNIGQELHTQGFLGGAVFKKWLPIYTTDLETNPNLKPNLSN